MKPTYTSKYEATKHMKRHIIVTTTTEAREETTRWRQREDNHKFSKQSGIQGRIDQSIEEANLRLSQKILDVVTEDRQNRTSEYAPGWRTGLSGTVIDCYPTAQKQVLNYKKFREDNRERDQLRLSKKLNIENQNMHQWLADQKTSYSRAELEKTYAKNRVLYNLYVNRPHTALHLKIYQTASKALHKEKSARDSYSLRGNASSAPTSAVASPNNSGVLGLNTSSGVLEFNSSVIRDGMVHNDNMNINNNKPTTRTRPTTTGPQSGLRNKLMKKINAIQSVEDFVNLSTNHNGEWNNATNDNVHNSNYNREITKYRTRDSYGEKRQISTSYLSNVPDLSAVGNSTTNMEIQRLFNANDITANNTMNNAIYAHNSSVHNNNKNHNLTGLQSLPAPLQPEHYQQLYQYNTHQIMTNHGDDPNNNTNHSSSSSTDFNMYSRHRTLSPPHMTTIRPQSSGEVRRVVTGNKQIASPDIVRRNIQSARDGSHSRGNAPISTVQTSFALADRTLSPGGSPPRRRSASPTGGRVSTSLARLSIDNSGGSGSGEGSLQITYHSDPVECIVVPSTQQKVSQQRVVNNSVSSPQQSHLLQQQQQQQQQFTSSLESGGSSRILLPPPTHASNTNKPRSHSHVPRPSPSTHYQQEEQQEQGQGSPPRKNVSFDRNVGVGLDPLRGSSGLLSGGGFSFGGELEEDGSV